MRKLIWLLTLIIVFSSGAAGAMELGGSLEMLPQGKWSLAAEGSWLGQAKAKDLTLNSTMRNQTLSISERYQLRDLKLENDRTWLAILSYGVLDRLNLFLQAGYAEGGKLIMDNAEAKLKGAFTYGLGAKGVLYESPQGLGLMAAAQYLRYDDRTVDDWTISGQAVNDATGYSTDDQADYWRADVVLTAYWKAGRFTPYLGAGWSHWELDYTGKWSNPANGARMDYDATLEAKDWWLALAGVEARLAEQWTLNLSGAFLGRTAVSLGLCWRF